MEAVALALLALGFLSPAAPVLRPRREPEGRDALSVVVFYDENGNGVLDPAEHVRIPGAVVEIGAGAARSPCAGPGAAGSEARTEKGSGRATIAGLPPGAYDLAVRPASLPPFYVSGKRVLSCVPASGEVRLPVTLPIGANRPNSYMAFGDSITEGDGSSDERGYCGRLERLLRDHFGSALVVADGVSGTDSHRGARRVGKALERHRPAVTLVLYGTNDWDEDSLKQGAGEQEAVTVNSLRRILRQVKAARSLPFLATLIPTNVGTDERASPERNRWLSRIDDRIRGLAHEEGAVLVDLDAAFARAPDPKRLYSDGLHPSDAGYELIAATFFDAITRRPQASPSTP